MLAHLRKKPPLKQPFDLKIKDPSTALGDGYMNNGLIINFRQKQTLFSGSGDKNYLIRLFPIRYLSTSRAASFPS